MSGDVLQIRLIGDLAVLKDGSPVRLPPSKKARALLAYLVLSPGPHRRERLCELFWQIPDDPRGSLRWALSKLRSVVNDGPERIEADREHVSFEHEAIDVDFVTARDAVANGLDALPTKDLAALADQFTGEFLGGLELSSQPDFEIWRLSQREIARKTYETILRGLIHRLDASPADQANRLYDAVRIAPYDTDLHANLISALARTGRKKEAEKQYAVSKRILKDIDGVDLASLRRAIDQKPQQSTESSGTGREEPALQQEIRFCKTDDNLQIAYATVGAGPPLVKTANWLNHLEFDWESPVWRHIFRAFSNERRFVRYDARGNGLSDWRVKDFSIEKQVNDLEAVVDAAGLTSFPLVGISQGCAISVKFAARHPDRVTKLILYGGYARGWKIGVSSEYKKNTEAMITLVRNGWGQDNPVFRQMFASLFMPDAPAENHDWFNELQRMTTSPENAAKLLEALGDVDVRDCLPQVKAPTLVIHARGDMRVPFEAAKELVVGIPDARFVQLETNNHLIPECDPAWPRFRDAVDDFLAA